ncbi:MAG: WXG100 family type VII secretion target [Ruminococcus sp.]|nr:WXG100 family type VII secretion target [Ruminococcus sp.]
MSATIKVTSQQLITTADEFGNQSKTVGTILMDMQGLTQQLTSIWTGEASTAFHNKMVGLHKDVQLLNRMIQEHVKDLKEIANEYVTVERNNNSTASNLASGILS